MFKVGCIFITASAELFQNPSLTHLTYALQDQGLAVGKILPSQHFFEINRSAESLLTFLLAFYA